MLIPRTQLWSSKYNHSVRVVIFIVSLGKSCAEWFNAGSVQMLENVGLQIHLNGLLTTTKMDYKLKRNMWISTINTCELMCEIQSKYTDNQS